MRANVFQANPSRIFRSLGLLLCLSAVSTSSLAVRPGVAATVMLAQAGDPAGASCPAEQQQSAERAINTLLEQAQQAVYSGRVYQASQLLVQALQGIQAMGNSQAKADLLQRLVGSVSEDFAYTGPLEQLVQAVSPENPDAVKAVLAVLTPAREATQGLSSGYSAAKTRTFVALANYYTQLGQPDQSRQILPEALAASQAIQGAAFEAPALRDIAAAYINAGQADFARPILERSQAVALTINSTNPQQRGAELERIAQLYAQANQLDQALQTVSLVGRPGQPSNALLTVADKYSEAGQIDRALEVASTLPPEQKALALATIAGRLTAQQPEQAAQRYAEAMTTARAAQNANQAVANAALRYVTAGGTVATADETLQALNGNDPQVQAPALVAIALQYAKTGQEELVEARLAQAIEALATVPEEWSRNSIRQQLIDQTVELGRYDYALQIAVTIQAGEEAPFQRVDALTLLADRALAAGRYDAALQITEQIPPSFVSWRENLFPRVARGFVATGQLDQALAIAQQENPNPIFRPRVLAAVAAQLDEVGQPEQSAALFAQAEQLANAIDDAHTRTEALGAIAQSYLDAGQAQPAARVLDQAIASTQGISEVASRAFLLRSIAEQLTFVNYYQAALQVAEAIPEDSERTARLNEALEKSVAMGDLATVLEVLQRVDNPVLKTRWLVAVANAYHQLGQTDAALDTLGQALEAARTIPGDESLTIVVRGGESRMVIDDDQDRGSFLGAIALRYAQFGQRSRAQQVAQTLQSADLRQQAMAQIDCYR
ncbi:MAG TPA: hypothetical protein V6D06_06425 [Trichocoleus sp.]